MALVKDGLHPQLLLTDYHLPDGDGQAVVRQIRSALAEPIPALLMTGDTTASFDEDSDGAGIRVLHKPLDGDELIANITALLSSAS